MLAGVVTVTDMPSITDGVTYIVHVGCMIVTGLLLDWLVRSRKRDSFPVS